MSVLETFIDIVDVSRFPETPEDMHRLLEIERRAKRDHGLTHRGINGYVFMGQEVHHAYGLSNMLPWKE